MSAPAHPPVAFELVIFDCDGVLVDSERVTNAVLAEMLRGLGLDVTLEQVLRDYVGRTTAACVALIEERLGGPLPANFLDEYRVRTEAALRERLQPVPGVREALDRITVPVCVASSGEPEKMRLTLGLTGLLEHFDGNLFSATQVPRSKPHPDVFLLAADRMGVPPARAAVVEDSPVGVQAGVAAGMTVFGYAAAGKPGELAAAGAITFDDMRDLPALLARGR